MKKLVVLTILFLSIAIQQKSNAQVRLNLNLNIGSQPAWGPEGYDHAEYYYMPDIDAYYNVPQRQFVYMEGNRWTFANSLPPRYNGYNLYNGYKVVVNEPNPYLHADEYRNRYAKYKGGHGPRQIVIRDSHDQRYKNHGRDEDSHDRGNGKDHGNGRDKDNDHGNGRDKDRDHGNGRDKDKDHGNGKDKDKGHGRGHDKN